MITMIYNIAVDGEQEEVKTLWKLEQVALGIPYMTDINDYINDNQLYVIRDNNKIVAYCTYDIMKQHPEVRLSALVVAPEYRGRGLSKELIYQIYKVNDNLIDKLHYPFVAEAKEGVPNNTFYDKISTNMTRSQKKTCVIRTYTLDVDKVRQWGPSKWL
jgi:GNAT superfamily N-acetyltransferase